ncbi:MAG: phosphoadenylyl-sulfate reductase, partial [Methylovirgula sp.]
MSAPEGLLFGDQIAASRVAEKFFALDAQKLLRLAIEDLFPRRIALVSSFGADSAVLLHMISEIDPATAVLFLDTLQLFPETLTYRDQLVEQLGLTNVVTLKPDEKLLAAEDPDKFLWAHNPDRCCEIRKVLPLAAALQPYDAWITGRKRFQAATRATLPLFEAEGTRVKINPLAAWT